MSMIKKPFEYTVDPNNIQQFEVYFNKVSKPVLSYKEEVIRTVKYIKDSTDRPLYISLSGGVDSEVIVRACLEANINFTAFIVKFEDDKNKHDNKYANALVEKYKIDSFICSLNATDYFKNGYLKYKAAGYHSRNIFRYLQLYILETVETLGGCAILGGREEPFQVVNDDICIPWVKDQALSSEWMINNNSQHYPYFFLSTPEIIASYLQTPLLKMMLKDPSYYACKYSGYVPEKALIYHRDWPEMVRRSKYNGFEKLLRLRKETEDMLCAEIPAASYYLPIKTLKEQLGISDV